MKLNQKWHEQWHAIDIPVDKLDSLTEKIFEQQVTEKKEQRFNLFTMMKKHRIAFTIGCVAVFCCGLFLIKNSSIEQKASTAMEKSESLVKSKVSSGDLNQEVANEESENKSDSDSLLQYKSGIGGDKVVSSYTITQATNSFKKGNQTVQKTVKDYSGYIENSYISNSAANYQLRIPKEHLEECLEKLHGIGTTTNEQINTTDYSVNYVDNESHINALAAEETALIELLKKTTSLDDMIKIQERLTNIRTNRETLTKKNKQIDHAVEYVPVQLDLIETDDSEVAQPMKNQIQKNWQQQLEFWKNFAQNSGVFIASNLLYILVVVVILGGLFKKYRKKYK
ncbi:DUF4349 domain-containing protein [Enterococcus sp. LJL99]